MMHRSSTTVRTVVLSVLLLTLLLQGCGRAVNEPANDPGNATGNETPPAPTEEPGGAFAIDQASFTPEDADPQIAQAQLAFAFDLFRETYGSEPEANRLISPVSIATALAMTVGGAQGETQAEMLRTLHLEGLSDEARNQGHQVLLDLLTHSGEEAQVLIANALWGNEAITFEESFLASAREAFGAEIHTVDMGAPETPDTINAWVREHTADRIESIIEPPIDPDTAMFLLNAVYLNANWASPFNEENTTQRPFTDASGQSSDVDMMHLSSQLDYAVADGIEAIRLPYKENQLSMLVFLPDESIGLAGLMEQLEPTVWQSWLEAFEPAMGELRLPKFVIEDELGLNEPLQALGINLAFDEAQADFSGMANIQENIFIKEVKHKATIEVNETGTIAAAATSVEAGITSAPSETFDLEFNRPFFYAITDERTGAILFMGTVNYID